MSVGPIASPQQPQIIAEEVSKEGFRASLRSREEVTYAGEDGRSFRLSINRATEVTYATYDRRALLAFGNASGARGLASFSDVSADNPVATFRSLLEAMGFAAHPGRMTPAPPFADKGAVLEQERIELLRINDSITIDMNEIDTEYWSVENTAQRLVDFAVSLYQGGGDREAHLEKMIAGMEQGYAEAKDAFGGFLPDISRRTVDLAKERLTAWARQSGENAAPAEPSAA